VDEFHVAAQRAVGAVLCAVLHDAAVLLGGGDDLAALVDIVRDGFFDVDVLARLAGPDRGEGVPVVGRGDGDGVDVFVLQRVAHVLVELRGLALRVGDELRTLFAHLRIDVAERDVLGVALHREEVFDVGAALAVEADGANADAVIGPDDGALSLHAGDDDGRGTGAEKLTTREVHDDFGVGLGTSELR
jgi:hypothetical protein